MPSKKVLTSIFITIATVTVGYYWLSDSSISTSNRPQQKTSKTANASSKDEKPNKDEKSKGSRPTPVLAASVKKADLNIVYTAVGTVVSPTTVTVKSRVNGQLTKIYFQEGQTVKAGDLLAELDSRSFQAALTQMEGQALRDQAMLRNSQLDLERFKTLLEQDSIASQQVDAQASLVQQYQGTIKADQGLVENAKLQLSFTKITAPISGRIGLRQVDVGNNILTTDNLAVINAIDPIQVLFSLPESRVTELLISMNESKKTGGQLSVEAWDRSSSSLLAKGVLKSLDNQIDAASGTIKLKAEFKNKDSLLYPNQFVNVKLLSNTLKNVLLIPLSAVQRSNSGEFVYLIKQDNDKYKVVVTPVTTGINDGIHVEIKSGLEQHQRVVVSGVDKLRNDAKVIVSGDARVKNHPSATKQQKPEPLKKSEQNRQEHQRP